MKTFQGRNVLQQKNTHTLCCVDCHLHSYYLQTQRDDQP